MKRRGALKEVNHISHYRIMGDRGTVRQDSRHGDQIAGVLNGLSQSTMIRMIVPGPVSQDKVRLIGSDFSDDGVSQIQIRLKTTIMKIPDFTFGTNQLGR